MARHTYLCPLRWADVDVYGVVNNVAFVRYLEEARVDLILCMAPGEQDSFLRRGSVVVRHEVDYKNPLVHRREPVEIELWVSRLRASSITISYVVKDVDHIYASARTVLAPFDYKARRPRRLTDAEAAFFTTYLEADIDGEDAVRAGKARPLVPREDSLGPGLVLARRRNDSFGPIPLPGQQLGSKAAVSRPLGHRFLAEPVGRATNATRRRLRIRDRDGPIPQPGMSEVGERV